MENKKIYRLNISVTDYHNTNDANVLIQKKDISLKEIGIYAGMHEYDYENNILKKIVKETVKKNIDWNNIKTIYRSENLTLSRDKLSLLKSKYNIKIIRDQSIADVSIISEKTIEKLFYNNGGGYYCSNWTLETFKNHIKKLEHMMTSEAYDHLINLTSLCPDGSIIQGIGSFSNWNTSDSFRKSKLYDLNDLFHSDTDINRIYYILTENQKEWEALNDPSKIFVLDVYVNEVCSEDSVILNWENYESISKMLNSTSEDRAVAMTLMSNCKIEESKTILALLFYHKGNHMKGSPVWNQVAFKTLRKQFDHYIMGHYGQSHSGVFSKLIHKLAEDNALTEESITHICTLVFERVLNNGCGFNNEDSAFDFKLEDVKLKQHYKDILIKQNQTLSQFVAKDVYAIEDLPF
jgi:hypothetical protein